MIPNRLLTALWFMATPVFLPAEEGMWTFDNLPLKALQEKYNWAPDQAWLDHLRLASVRFPGGSGAFVSAEGLVLTNHHVARGSIQLVSSQKANYVAQGFVAKTREEELKIPGLELEILQSYQNVTERVNAVVKPGMSDKAAGEARKAELDRIQGAEQKASGLKCQMVTLYQGGEYWVYRYKKFSDVRLVASPEEQIAFFGGDWDNYSFPRFNLDFALLRVYEEGKAYRPAHFLKWTSGGLKHGDLTLVSGHPGATERQITLEQMLFARDFYIPMRLKSWERQRKDLQVFARTGEEPRRLASDSLYAIENYLKRFKGFKAGLHDAEAVLRLEKAEKELKSQVSKQGKLQAQTGTSWEKIRQTVAKEKQFYKAHFLITNPRGELLGHALNLWRLPIETAKPNEKRLSEYTEANLKATKGKITREKPYHADLETALLASWLQELQEELGPQDPAVKSLLKGKRPMDVARMMVAESKLGSSATRKELLEGGATAIAACQDPMMALAKALDPIHRQIKKRYEEEIQSVYTEQGGRIAQARFAIHGKSQYPDATFTLRLTYGPVSAYPANGTLIQPFTTYYGLYDRYESWGGNATSAENGAWKLPSRWLEKKDKLDLRVPFNFVYAADTIGGNSGSPVVDRKGELVGLNFDGNIEGLVGRYYYDSRAKRSIAVDARAILEALKNVMDASHVAAELEKP